MVSGGIIRGRIIKFYIKIVVWKIGLWFNYYELILFFYGCGYFLW